MFSWPYSVEVRWVWVHCYLSPPFCCLPFLFLLFLTYVSINSLNLSSHPTSFWGPIKSPRPSSSEVSFPYIILNSNLNTLPPLPPPKSRSLTCKTNSYVIVNIVHSVIFVSLWRQSRNVFMSVASTIDMVISQSADISCHSGCCRTYPVGSMYRVSGKT